MKTYSKAEIDSFDDRAEWVPAEVAQRLYRALEKIESETAATWVCDEARAAMAFADGDSNEDAQA